jgi:transposase
VSPVHSGLKAWLAQLTSHTHYNVAGVALANKLVRTAWAVLARQDDCRPRVVAAASA